MPNFICAVPNCTSAMNKNPDKKFIAVPRQDVINKKWRETLGIPESASTAIICEDHLLVEDKLEVNADMNNEKSKRLIPCRFFSKSKKKQRTIEPKKNELSISGELNETISAVDINFEDNSSSPCVFSEESNDLQLSTNGNDHEYDSDNSRSLVIKSEPEDIEAYDISQTEVYSKYVATENCIVTTLENMGIPFSKLNDDSPRLVILDQPEPSYRFRYKRESSRPHGPMKGRSFSHKSLKNSHGPKVKLCNFKGDEAVIRVWLYCSDGPSPHQLVSTSADRKRCQQNPVLLEPHSVTVNQTTEYACSFDRLNILHVVCSDVSYQQQYYHKKVFSSSNSYFYPSEPPPFNAMEVKEEIKKKEKDIACLFFEAFEKTIDGYRKLCDIFSEDIKNKKSPKTNDLRIMKQSHEAGSCRGNQQVFIFTERLIKDVFVEFFEEDENGEITWSSKASFSETDIHKQVAICFCTPPYKDLHIVNPVTVFFRLVRLTDGAYSHNRTYRYLPVNYPGTHSDSQSLDCPRWSRKRDNQSPKLERIDQITQCDLGSVSSTSSKNKKSLKLCKSEVTGVQLNSIKRELQYVDPSSKTLVPRTLLPVQSKLVPITNFPKFVIQSSSLTKILNKSAQ